MLQCYTSKSTHLCLQTEALRAKTSSQTSLQTPAHLSQVPPLPSHFQAVQADARFGCESVWLSPENSSGKFSPWDGAASSNPKHLGGANKGFATPQITPI